MKLAVVLIAVVQFLAIAEGGNKCVVERGVELKMFSESTIKMKIPCKYHMVNQVCGSYKVVITPGNKFLFPSYIVDTVWMSVYNATDDFLLWQGRSTNKVAAMYIIKKGEREAVNQKNGTLETGELFVVSNSSKDVTVTARNGDFSLSFGPFDFNGNKHSDNRLVYTCNDPEEVDYPKQYCGSKNPKVLKNRTTTFFKKTKNVDQMVMYDVFTDTNIAQIDENCKRATHILVEKCQSEETRKEAIKVCHFILDSTGHRLCAIKFGSDPMEIFVNCLEYVCGGYNKSAPSCESIGHSIDMCRRFPGLTESVKEANCYKDLMTAEDNPFYPLQEEGEDEEAEEEEEDEKKERERKKKYRKTDDK